MFERFTVRARHAVEAAFESARQSPSREIRPEHLLAALLEDEACWAVRVLEDLGATATGLRDSLARSRADQLDGLDADDEAALASIGIDLAEVLSRIGDTPRVRRPPGRTARSSRATKKALGLALREAQSLGHPWIGTEHLLLGLVGVDDATVRDALLAAGIDPSAVRPAVAAAVGRAG